MTQERQEVSGKVFTIPNILSFLRIAIIPIFMYEYIAKDNYAGTAVLFVFSGLTDIVDGRIARKYNLITDIGKALDPIADKLTQFCMMICLLTRFRHMLIPMILIFVKEISSGVLGLMTLKKTGLIEGAVWHGKVNTVLLFTVMTMHLLWIDIPVFVSNISIAVCCVMMLYSFVRYSLRFAKLLKENKEKEA